MTDKQERILEAALELFAANGYAATSTSSIAKKAGVSEGLIFRHFTNKQGLLSALMSMAEKKLADIYGPIFMENDPSKILKMSIEAPFNIDKKEHDFWRLQFMLKWQKEYNNPDKMKPVLDRLEIVFSDLGYEDPLNEARYLILVIEAITMELLKGNMSQSDNIHSFLIKKYKLSPQ